MSLVAWVWIGIAVLATVIELHAQTVYLMAVAAGFAGPGWRAAGDPTHRRRRSVGGRLSPGAWLPRRAIAAGAGIGRCRAGSRSHCRSEGEQQAAINRASGDAQAIELVAKATANAIKMIAASVEEPGGREALQLQVAKEFVAQFGNVAKAGTTILLPANLGDIGGLVETALQIIKTDGKAKAAGT